ncbi:MAG: aminoglycoside phosphotransferase family protein [Trueperaceae bacterium]
MHPRHGASGGQDLALALVQDEKHDTTLPFVDTPWTDSVDVPGIGDALAPGLRLAFLVGLGALRHEVRGDAAGVVEERLYLCEPLPGHAPGDFERFAWNHEPRPRPTGLPESLERTLNETLARLRSEEPDANNWPPFTLPGFHARLASALDAKPALRGEASLGTSRHQDPDPEGPRLHQLRAWTLSSVWVGARSVLKAPNPLWRTEPAVTALVGRYAPDAAPTVLAHGEVEVPGGKEPAPWMVMRRVVGAEVHGDEHRTRLAFEIGGLQRRLLPHEHELRAAGMPDRLVVRTEAELDGVWASPELAKLEAEDRARLPALDAWIRQKLRAFAITQPPAVLTHGDLHCGNAIERVHDDAGTAGPAPLVLIDWTDVAFAWPGVDLFTIAGFEADLDGEVHAALQRAYIAGLAGAIGASPEAMVRRGVELSPVYHLVSYVQIARALPPRAGWEVEGVVRYLARLLLRRMDGEA